MKLDFGQCKQSPPDHQNTKLIFVTFYFQYNNRTLVRCIRNFLVISNRMFFPAPAFLNRLPLHGCLVGQLLLDGSNQEKQHPRLFIFLNLGDLVG